MGIGVMFQKLEQLGLADDTLILFMSDNANIAKYTCYEGGAHVPAMARWPGRIQPGSKCDQIVCNLDLVPTILDVAGIKPPAERHARRPEHPADPSGPRPGVAGPPAAGDRLHRAAS